MRATAARRLSASLLLGSLMVTIVPLAGNAATDKTLERVKGSVSYDMGDN